MPQPRSAFAALFMLAVAGCGGPEGYPSLAPRPIETLATTDETAPAPAATPAVDPAIAAQLAALTARAVAGKAAFDKELANAARAVAAPGARKVASEAWVAAQQALTRADAARGEVGAALADIDALRLAGAQTGGGSAAAMRAWESVSALAAEQDRAYQALAGSLPSQ